MRSYGVRKTLADVDFGSSVKKWKMGLISDLIWLIEGNRWLLCPMSTEHSRLLEEGEGTRIMPEASLRSPPLPTPPPPLRKTPAPCVRNGVRRSGAGI